MILSMRMHNIALIEDLTLEFSEGLHVMTGETGAGKSIVVDAVNLVLGGRADRDLIRTGTERPGWRRSSTPETAKKWRSGRKSNPWKTLTASLPSTARSPERAATSAVCAAW